ncbi:MAG: MutS-related protein [Aureliella sp.]
MRSHLSDANQAPAESTSAHAETSARSEYESRRGKALDSLAELDQKHKFFVGIRSLLFVLAVVGLGIGYLSTLNPTLFRSLGWLGALGFVVAIATHEHIRLKRLFLRSNVRLYEHLLARLDRQWANIPSQALLPEFAELEYADDLDLAGPNSLLALVGLANSFPGNRTLQYWLATPAPWTEITDRQRAVQALIPCRDLRLRLIQTIRSTSSERTEPYGLAEWATSPNWLPQHPFGRLWSFIGPTLVVGAVAAILIGLTLEQRSWTTGGAIALGAGFLINIAVTVFWGSWIHDIFQRVTGEHRACYQFASVFGMMDELPNAASDTESQNSPAGERDFLREIREVAGGHRGENAQAGFAKLLSIVRLANLQRDVFFYFVYLVLQLTLLYDFRILYRLEKWKDRFGVQVDGWFNALGKCEAFVSMSTLADEYPDWAFPTDVSTGTTALHASELGHPLLSDQDRVVNDFSLTTERPLMVVTGSNMAGKSTFMRSIGLNLLLARAGGPVCASHFESPSYELASSIRIRDSLGDGVSFFMAELKRLKEVVDLAEQHSHPTKSGDFQPQILFLLDEILQGTNSQERQIAVASVLDQLLQYGAAGFISTHDLDLADAPEVKATSQVVHFREFFETVDGKEVMRFDYRMRPGSTPTTNALKLLNLVGLGTKPK